MISTLRTHCPMRNGKNPVVANDQRYLYCQYRVGNSEGNSLFPPTLLSLQIDAALPGLFVVFIEQTPHDS